MFYYLSILFFKIDFYVVFGYRLSQCIEAGCLMAPLPGLHLLLGYHYDYAIHGTPYTSAHVLIENTLVQHEMAKNSRMVLCYQN